MAGYILKSPTVNLSLKSRIAQKKKKTDKKNQLDLY